MGREKGDASVISDYFSHGHLGIRTTGADLHVRVEARSIARFSSGSPCTSYFENTQVKQESIPGSETLQGTERFRLQTW